MYLINDLSEANFAVFTEGKGLLIISKKLKRIADLPFAKRVDWEADLLTHIEQSKRRYELLPNENEKSFVYIIYKDKIEFNELMNIVNQQDIFLN